jgi:hypothetical protein
LDTNENLYCNAYSNDYPDAYQNLDANHHNNPFPNGEPNKDSKTDGYNDTDTDKKTSSNPWKWLASPRYPASPKLDNRKMLYILATVVQFGEVPARAVGVGCAIAP